MHGIPAIIRNNHVELTSPVDWPDGTRVMVVPISDVDVDAAMPVSWSPGFFDEIRKVWCRDVIDHPPQGEFEVRDDW